MIVEIIYTLLYIPFLWLSPIVDKRMHEAAVRRGWKKPEEYNTFGNILFIIPAQGVTKLLTDHTDKSFFLYGLADISSLSGFFLNVALGVSVFLVLLLFARYIQKHFIFKKSNTTSE
jgi:hypothetical protein